MSRSTPRWLSVAGWNPSSSSSASALVKFPGNINQALGGEGGSAIVVAAALGWFLSTGMG